MDKITTIYGASDDLIELDGAIDGEVYCYNSQALVIFDSGAALLVHYDDEGIWRIRSVGVQLVTITRCEDRDGYTGPDGDVYSDLATVGGATIAYAATGAERVR